LAIALKSSSFCFCYCTLLFCYYSYCCFFFIYYSSLDFKRSYSLGSLATVTCYVFYSYSFGLIFFLSFLSSSSLAPLTLATKDLLFSLSCRSLMSAFSLSSLTLCYRFLSFGNSSSGIGSTCTYSLMSSPFFLYSYNFSFFALKYFMS